MKQILLLLLLSACAAAGHAQRDTLDLSGVWQSSLGACRLPGTTDESHLGGPRQTSGPTSQLTRLYPFRGQVTYERDVEIPQAWRGRVLTLLLERTKPSTLWVDGDSIGHIGQLFAPHTYALPALKPGRHHIRLLIDNRDEAVPEGVRGSHAWTDATQTNWNGVIGRMAIVATGRTFIESVTPTFVPGKGEVEVRIGIGGEASRCKSVLLRLYDPRGCLVAETKSKIKVEAKAEAETKTKTKAEAETKGEGMAKTKAKTAHLQIKEPQLWSEFHPSLYTLVATMQGKGCRDEVRLRFGLRTFGTAGTQFTINGKRTFLRGTHDGCVFPLTGYAPADVDAWRRLFAIVKQYGLNHVRFHSYTPTEAAFEAADELGIYLHTELPMWGTLNRDTREINDFLLNEAHTTLRWAGNHPSFMALGLGNELWIDAAMAREWTDTFRALDPRHLYYFGANNDLGFHGPKEGEDFYTTCRVGGDGSDTTRHARTSFSFADADGGGILNSLRPNTVRDFGHAVSLCDKPIVSHETCQFQIYPDYRDIPKYTGVLYPYSMEAFRDRLKANGLTGQIDDFHQSTGRWAVDCYKADMEQCLRTQGFGGYQLLDLKDYPGQGSALVGILDAFMDSKGIVTPDTFCMCAAPIVPLALLPAHCYSRRDTLTFDIAVANYSEDDYSAPLTWTLGNKSGRVECVHAPQGTVSRVAHISIPLYYIKESTQLRLSIQTGEHSAAVRGHEAEGRKRSGNYYNLWVYADEPVPESDVLQADTLSAAVEQALSEGRTVLLTPRHEDIKGQSVGGLFTPDYWNYAMFKSISENNRRPVSPGTLGMLMDNSHPLFSTFPTEGRTDWQWWPVALHSRPLILDTLPHDYLPIVQTVDNIERNHKLGIVLEFRVGKGRLLLCTTDLQSISAWPEGRAFAAALRRYAASPDFRPAHAIDLPTLRTLLYSQTEERDIKGVKNITDYKKKDS